MTPRTSKFLVPMILLSFCSAAGSQQDKTAEMIPAKYDRLKAEVLKQRGKVVVVDFWAGYCGPCKAAMPHLVEMHKKHADEGLVVITVSVDPPNQKDLIEQANKFLRELKPPFLKLHLDESDEFWSKKLDFNIPPCYFVFDRRGKWTRFRGDDYRNEAALHKEMDPLILRLLSEK